MNMTGYLVVVDQNSFVQQTLLLCRHHKVMSLILESESEKNNFNQILVVPDLVIHHILQGNAKLVVEVVEELLVENEGHSRNLFNLTFGLCMSAIKNE